MARDRFSDRRPERRAERASERYSERTSDRYSERSPERYSDRFADEDSDRISRRRSERSRKSSAGRDKFIELFQYDTNLIIAVFFLMIFGLVMLHSASYYATGLSAKYNYDSAALLKSQLRWDILGIAAMFVVANIDYHRFRFFAIPGLILSILLVFLLLTPLGVTLNGATRWLKIPGLGQFQVAEPIKIAMILFSAFFITKYVHYLQGRRWKQVWVMTFMLMIPALFVGGFLFLVSNNMSTAFIVVGISALMVFIVHPQTLPFLLIIGAVVGAAAGYVALMLRSVGSADPDGGFRSARIMAWLDPYSYESTKAYQSLQALYAIGSGGLFGKGLGNSIQKLGRIPEPYNDMIFSIVCEELGIFGAGLVIAMFIYLLYRVYTITQRAEDLFGRMLAIGVFGHIALQVVLNLLVVTSLIPTTGVTLPFFSHGGTASVFLFMEFGMVLSVDKVARRNAEKREEKA